MSCKVLRTRYARGKKGELGDRMQSRNVKLFICTQERARRETDDRTDEQIGRKFRSDGSLLGPDGPITVIS